MPCFLKSLLPLQSRQISLSLPCAFTSRMPRIHVYCWFPSTALGLLVFVILLTRSHSTPVRLRSLTHTTASERLGLLPLYRLRSYLPHTGLRNPTRTTVFDHLGQLVLRFPQCRLASVDSRSPTHTRLSEHLALLGRSFAMFHLVGIFTLDYVMEFFCHCLELM